MTQEQAARIYAERDIDGVCFQEGGLDREDAIECMVGAYLAGSESRQAEIDELLEALENLVFLHGCEQEGLACGQPTAKQWYAAVVSAQKAIDKAKGE